MDDNEQEDGKTDSDTDDDSITLATMLNETKQEQQQNTSSENAPIFTTPDKRNKSSILIRTTETRKRETAKTPYLRCEHSIPKCIKCLYREVR
jgi:hypothetical protein